MGEQGSEEGQAFREEEDEKGRKEEDVAAKKSQKFELGATVVSCLKYSTPIPLGTSATLLRATLYFEYLKALLSMKVLNDEIPSKLQAERFLCSSSYSRYRTALYR